MSPRRAADRAADRVYCRYCREYPAWNKQPGSGTCVQATTGRSFESRPCIPRLTLMGRIRKLLGLRIG